jgi:hypothetical protein
VLNQDVCEKCLKVTMSHLPWFDCEDNRVNRYRFWKNGYVHCYQLQNHTIYGQDEGECEMVRTELWAGDPLPELPENTKWSSVTEGIKITLPPPSWCPYALEHIVSDE